MGLLSIRARSFWRAVGAGLIAYCASFVALTLLYWLLRPFVWAAIYGEPYSPPPGPYSPNSGEWLYVQGIGFLTSVCAGAAAARWSLPGSLWALALFVLVPIAFVIVGGVPTDTSNLRVAIYALEGPLGVIAGAALYTVLRKDTVAPDARSST